MSGSIATPEAERQLAERETAAAVTYSQLPDPSTFRGLIKEVSGRTITSKQAANLLEVLGPDLESDITKAIRGFVVRHFGKK